MTTPGRPVSEDDLHAYVDGFLSVDDRARVEHYLAATPDAAARVRGWQDSQAILRRALAPKVREPVPSAMTIARLVQERRRSAWAPRRAAAGIVLALAVGTGAGWWARGSDMPHGLAGLGQQAAMAQRVFASDDVRPVDFRTADATQRLGWAGQANGRTIGAPDLSSTGYRLVEGRTVATEQGAAPVFLYQNARGDRISVFVRLMAGIDMEASMRPVEANGVTGFAWSHDGVGFSLVSGKPEPTLRDLSNRVRDAMREHV